MTDEHPVYVVSGIDLQTRPDIIGDPNDEAGTTDGGRWVMAEDLHPGDVLRTSSGGTVSVDSIATSYEDTRVYNLTIANDHTFAVGTDSILVHNGCTGAQFELISKNWQKWFGVTEQTAADGAKTFRVGDVTLINAGNAAENGGVIDAVLKDGTPISVTFTYPGFADFTPFLYTGEDGANTVSIVYTGVRVGDRKAASIRAGFVDSNGKWYEPKGYTWHHNQALGKMQLVRTDVHELVRHTGGFAIFRAGMRKIYTDAGLVIPPQFL